MNFVQSSLAAPGRRQQSRLARESVYVHVDLGHPADEQLELRLVEHGDQLLRDHLREAAHERAELIADALVDAVLDDEVDVLGLVGLGDGDVRAVGLQVDRDQLAEAVFGGAERLIEDVGDVVLPDMFIASSRNS